MSHLLKTPEKYEIGKFSFQFTETYFIIFDEISIYINKTIEFITLDIHLYVKKKKEKVRN